MQTGLGYILPVETEYRKVVFHSKSEAILARNFDLLGLPWIYEPKQLTQEDLWRPDFWVIIPCKQPNGFRSVLLEYKPRQPTAEYMRKLAARFTACDELMPTAEFFLFVADPFDPTSERLIERYSVSDDQWISEDSVEVFSALNDAKNFRFDLMSEAA